MMLDDGKDARHVRARGRTHLPEAPRVVGVEEVARVGRLVHRRLYLQGHFPALGRPIIGLTGPETVVERLGMVSQG